MRTFFYGFKAVRRAARAADAAAGAGASMPAAQHRTPVGLREESRHRADETSDDHRAVPLMRVLAPAPSLSEAAQNPSRGAFGVGLRPQTLD